MIAAKDTIEEAMQVQDIGAHADNPLLTISMAMIAVKALKVHMDAQPEAPVDQAVEVQGPISSLVFCFFSLFFLTYIPSIRSSKLFCFVKMLEVMKCLTYIYVCVYVHIHVHMYIYIYLK